jgi:hypothetical protein
VVALSFVYLTKDGPRTFGMGVGPTAAETFLRCDCPETTLVYEAVDAHEDVAARDGHSRSHARMGLVVKSLLRREYQRGGGRDHQGRVRLHIDNKERVVGCFNVAAASSAGSAAKEPLNNAELQVAYLRF